MAKKQQPYQELPIKGFNLPTREQLVFDKLATMIEVSTNMVQALEDGWECNANEQAFLDLIESSTVPPDETLHIYLYGATGSGKSWIALHKALNVLLSYPGATGLACRRTSQDIKDSIMKDAEIILNRFNIPYEANLNDTWIKMTNGSKLTMRSDKALVLAKKDKSDSLGSQAFSIVIFEEADSLSEELADTIPARMRENKGEFRKLIIYIANPPDEGHWLYRKFFLDNLPNDPASPYRALKCGVEANRKHLSKGYIESNTRDLSRTSVNLLTRFVEGEHGPDIKGFPIYGKSFSLDRHVSKVPLVNGTTVNFNPKFPILRGWDFGYRGNCMIIGQDDKERRQIRFFHCILVERRIFEEFSDDMIQFCNECYPGADWEDYCDPNGDHKTNHSKNSEIEVLKKKGIYARSKRRGITYGINLCIQQLRSVGDNQKPALLICPTARLLIKTIAAGYCNHKEAPNDVISPVKDGRYDHVADTWRYLMTGIRVLGDGISMVTVDDESMRARDGMDWQNVDFQGDARTTTIVVRNSNNQRNRPQGVRSAFGRSLM